MQACCDSPTYPPNAQPLPDLPLPSCCWWRLMLPPAGGSHLKSSSCPVRLLIWPGAHSQGPALTPGLLLPTKGCPGAFLGSSWTGKFSPTAQGLSEHPQWKEADSLPVPPADEVAFARPSPVRTGAREGLRGQGSQSGSSGPRGQRHKARCGAPAWPPQGALAPSGWRESPAGLVQMQRHRPAEVGRTCLFKARS